MAELRGILNSSSRIYLLCLWGVDVWEPVFDNLLTCSFQFPKLFVSLRRVLIIAFSQFSASNSRCSPGSERIRGIAGLPATLVPAIEYQASQLCSKQII